MNSSQRCKRRKSADTIQSSSSSSSPLSCSIISESQQTTQLDRNNDKQQKQQTIEKSITADDISIDYEEQSDSNLWLNWHSAMDMWKKRKQLLEICSELKRRWENRSITENNSDTKSLLDSTCKQLLQAAIDDGYKIGSSSLLVERFPLAVAINSVLPKPTRNNVAEWSNVVGRSLDNAATNIHAASTISYYTNDELSLLIYLSRFAQIIEPFSLGSDSTTIQQSTISLEWALRLNLIKTMKVVNVADVHSTIRFLAPLLLKWETDYLQYSLNNVETVHISEFNIASSSSFQQSASQCCLNHQLLILERYQLLQTLASLRNENQRLRHQIEEQQQRIEQLEFLLVEQM